MRTNFVNTGTVDVQAGTLLFDSVGALTHNGVLTIANGATLNLGATAATTHSINTASTTIAGTLQIGGDNFLHFTAPHTLDGSGTFLQSFGQVTGANLTLAPTLKVTFGDGGQSGAATTTAQGATTINSELRLDGGRIFRNEGTVTQIGSVDMNSRRSGLAEAGNGSVTNALGGTWNSTGTNNFLFASNQGGTDNGAGATFTNAGTFNKQGAFTTTVRTNFVNTGTVDVQGGTVQIETAFTNGGIVDVATSTRFTGANIGFTNGAQGIMQGVGTLGVQGTTLVNDGILRPGAQAVGTLTVDGNYTQTSGTLDVQLASLNSTDVLNIQGNANFSGTIKVGSLSNFTPSLNDSFIVALFSGTRTGTFANIDASAFNGVSFTAIYDLHDVKLQVSAISAVPIPAAVWLLGSAFGGLGLVRRRIAA